jgi:DMSO/TMAO reductase YedYZ heme-binding membrane subunit
MKKPFEAWRLFAALALALSLANCLLLPRADFHTARGVQPVIQGSVRFALPLFLLAFTASSLAALWPGPLTRWLLRNSRYLGLGFAFGMAWHLSFVAYSVFSFGLFDSGLTSKGFALDLVGLIFLLLLTLTSFRWAARRLSSANWRRLHKLGVYTIWFVATYIYARHIGDLLHAVASTLLIAAWLLRIAAWMKTRAGPHSGVSSA